MTNNHVRTEGVTYISTACPDWCEGPLLHPYTEERPGVGTCRLHTGPEWGGDSHQRALFKVYGEEFTHSLNAVSLSVSLEIEGDVLPGLGAADLRKLAADALAAAEWIEARA